MFSSFLHAMTGLMVMTAFTPALAEDLRLFSGGAPQVVLRTLTSEFEQATGHRVVPTFALVTVIQQKLLAGEKADLILLPIPLIAATEKNIALRPAGRGVLARVGIAVIVRNGATRPAISTPDDVRTMLREARTIAVPQPDTPSGAHIGRMIEQFGVADAVRPKLVIKAAIDGGGELVARGEVDVGLYLLSEVQSIKGVAVVGLLPPPVQNYVVYGAAIPADNATPEIALAFLKFISDPARSIQWTAAGFELTSASNN